MTCRPTAEGSDSDDESRTLTTTRWSGRGFSGLAHAYQLARRGRRVIVFERNPRAIGASVRNFGMLWPIGQPLGPLRRLAMRSLQIWLEVLASQRPLARANRLAPPGVPGRRGTGPPGVRAGVLPATAKPVDLLTPEQVGERTGSREARWTSARALESARSMRRPARGHGRPAAVAFQSLRRRFRIRPNDHRGRDARGDLRPMRAGRPTGCGSVRATS